MSMKQYDIQKERKYQRRSAADPQVVVDRVVKRFKFIEHKGPLVIKGNWRADTLEHKGYLYFKICYADTEDGRVYFLVGKQFTHVLVLKTSKDAFGYDIPAEYQIYRALLKLVDY